MLSAFNVNQLGSGVPPGDEVAGVCSSGGVGGPSSGSAIAGRGLDLSTVNRSQMSRDLGIDVAHISRIFSGKSHPSLALARRIADYLHVSIDDLCKAMSVDQ